MRGFFSKSAGQSQPGKRYHCSIRDLRNEIELSFNGGLWDVNNSAAASNPDETNVRMLCSRLETNFLGLHRSRNVWARDFGNPVMNEGNWHGVSLLAFIDQRIFVGISSTVVEIDLSNGATIRETETAKTPVGGLIPSQDEELIIVYNDYYQFVSLEGLGNIVALDLEGGVKWRAELPYPDDVFSGPPRYIDGKLTAYTWNGHRCTIDDSSGKVTESYWTR